MVRLVVAAALALPPVVQAQGLPAFDAFGFREALKAAPKAKAPEARATSKRKGKGKLDSFVDIELRTFGQWTIHIEDFRNGIRIEGDRFQWYRVTFRGGLEAVAEEIFRGRPDLGMRLAGPGLNGEIRQWGDGFLFTGRLEEAGAQDTFQLRIDRGFGLSRWRVWEPGADLELELNQPWGHRLTGRVDFSRFKKKKLLALACAFAALAYPPQDPGRP